MSHSPHQQIYRRCIYIISLLTKYLCRRKFGDPASEDRYRLCKNERKGLLQAGYWLLHIERRLSGNLPNRWPPAHGIFLAGVRHTRTSNANRWAPGRTFSSIKYEHFVQVSSNQKHILIMFADVRCGQESISKQPWYILPAVMVILPAVTHAFRRVRK